MKLNMDLISIDGGTQPRASIHDYAVLEYAEIVRCGGEMPPVVVFYDGLKYWLADGFHRYHAHKQNGYSEIQADVRNGSLRDAVLFSLSANASHGLRRTNADKRKAITTALEHFEFGKWSDNQIAKACGVHHSTVGDVRRAIANSASEVLQERKYVTKHGTTATMNTENIGGNHTVLGEIKPAPSNSDCEAAQIEGNSAVSASEAPPQAQQEPVNTDLEEAYGDIDPVEEWQRAEKRITELEETLEAAQADDKAAEIIKWKRMYDDAVRKQNEQMDLYNASFKREKSTMSALRRCGRAVGVEDPFRVAAAVERMAREHSGVQ